LEKSSIPRRVRIKMKSKRRTEKEATSLRVCTIVSKRSWNLFQVLASLNTLRSLKALRAVNTDPEFLL
jgi:hypothetical protein